MEEEEGRDRREGEEGEREIGERKRKKKRRKRGGEKKRKEEEIGKGGKGER